MKGETAVFSPTTTTEAVDAEFEELFGAEPFFYVMVDVQGRAWARPAYGATVEDITVEPDTEAPRAPIEEVDSVAWTIWSGSRRSHTKIRGGKYKTKKKKKRS